MVQTTNRLGSESYSGTKIPRANNPYRFDSGCRHQKADAPQGVSAFLMSRKSGTEPEVRFWGEGECCRRRGHRAPQQGALFMYIAEYTTAGKGICAMCLFLGREFVRFDRLQFLGNSGKLSHSRERDVLTFSGTSRFPKGMERRNAGKHNILGGKK